MSTESLNHPSMHDHDNRSEEPNTHENLPEFHAVGHRVCQVLMPVTLCSIYVTFLVKFSEMDATKSGSMMAGAWSRLGLVTSTQDQQAVGKAVLGSLCLVLIFLGLIVAITLVILFVLYMEWHSCLSYYFYIPSLMIMSVITPAYLRVIGRSLNWLSLDLITLAIATWNFTALGMMAIFGLFACTPLIIQQLYLIHNSSLVAVLVVNFLPGWAPWILLGFLVIWDLFAVMAPFGPLNLIINLAERGGIVDMPGLVYSTDVNPKSQNDDSRNKSTHLESRPSDRDGNETSTDYHDNVGNPPMTGTVEGNPNQLHEGTVTMADTPKQGTPSRAVERDAQTSERRSVEDKGVNIGLGDFIFYGLLIGVTAKGQHPGEYYTTLATFSSILVGLIATLGILALTRRALPALPISIALGLIMAAFSIKLFPTLADTFASQQIFI